MKPRPAINNLGSVKSTDDKLGKGIDIALVTLTFLGLGYMLDRWLDTKPVFMIALVCLALVGEFVRFWYDYDSRMKVLEAQRAAAGSSRRTAAGDR
ncbi:MAG: AtpZ/AtpI family protein [Actinobacteria bacterium]|nr:AtpZ/AtpI family protein [Actinomycetota bacterium]